MTVDRNPRDRHFRRRLKAARAGVHLPSEEELLRGMPFLREQLSQDIREYANRLARRIRKRNRASLTPIAEGLEELAIEPSHHAVTSLETSLDALETPNGFPADECQLRCRFYRAAFGDPEAAAMVAAEMAKLALRDIRHEARADMMWRALGWAAHAAHLDECKRDGVFSVGSQPFAARDPMRLEHHFKRAIRWPPIAEPAGRQPEADDPATAEPEKENGETDTADPNANLVDGVVIVSSIGNDATAEGKRVAREFDRFINHPLALKVVPDLAMARSGLSREFPYAAAVVDKILKGLVGRRHVWLRPTILLGPPGCGKTRFARHVAKALRTPWELVSCGGMSDSAIGGTPRRWSTGEPSLPIMAIRRGQCANPIIILDEIEKIAASRHNGNAHDVLLGLLEAETARRWHEPYLESSCDLSHLSWLMTANSLEPIPAVLRDRCRIVCFPEPGPEQVETLAPRILQRLYVDAGHDRRWASPLEPFEIEALSNSWPGGSIRTLERLVEALMEAREQGRARQ